jgi:hypothetical protein
MYQWKEKTEIKRESNELYLGQDAQNPQTGDLRINLMAD